jgi:hypothetical protein
MNVQLILQGEFVHPDYQSAEAQAARASHIVHRLATVDSMAAVAQVEATAKNTPAVWPNADNSYTVVDIRPR